MFNDSKHKGRPYVPANQQMRRIFVSSVLCFTAYVLTRPGDSAKQQEHMSVEYIRMREEIESYGMISNTSWSLGFWLKSGLPNEFTPHIVWLATYKGSGEDYLMANIPRVSGFSVATNYGDKVTKEDSNSISIYPRHENGPYWQGLPSSSTVRFLPDEYVMTLTHCGMKCVDCPPSEYMNESLDDYRDACRNTTARVGAPKTKLTSFLYPLTYVKRMIHVVRNPYHNIIQKFYQELENAKEREDEEFLAEFSKSPRSFQKWCAHLDEKYVDEVEESYPKDVAKRAKKTTCHAEFYKFIQWHNLAFEALNIDSTLVIYYEDFHREFDETINSILDFTALPRLQNNKPAPFSKLHDYQSFYDIGTMRDSIRSFCKALASPMTWHHIEHYFDLDGAGDIGI